MKKKRRKRGTGNQYFTKTTEDSIVAYAATEDINIRTKLYVDEIKPALDELVDKIVYTYKFTSLNNIDVLTRDKVLGNTISGTIDVSSPTVNSIPTDDAVADYVTVTTNTDNIKTSKEVQIHSFFMSGLNI